MRKLSRGIAWLICLVMLLGMLPAVSLAADGDDAIDPTIPIFGWVLPAGRCSSPCPWPWAS